MDKATKLRRRVAGASLIAAPLLGVPTSQVWPDNPIDAAGRLAVIGESSARYLAANLMTVLLIVLFIPALLALVRLLRDPKPKLAYAGGALVALGIVGWSGTTGISLVELEMAQAADRPAMVALAEGVQSSVGAGVLLVMFLLGMFIGLIVLAVGLWRARIAPVWMPLVVAAAVVLDVVASTEQIAVAVVWILLTVALGWVGLRILRASDEDWEDASIGTTSAGRPPALAPTADA